MKKPLIILGAFVLILVFFVLGFLSVPTKNQQATTTPTPVPVQSITEWRKLKDVDDRALMACGDAFDTVSNIFDAQSRLDFDAVKKYNKELEGKTTKIQAISKERQAILDKLNY